MYWRYCDSCWRENLWGGGYSDEADFITGLARYAVPCFLMISGKFLLVKEENSDAGWFYNKEYRKLFPPMLVYSIIGVLFTTGKAVMNGGSLFSPFKNWLFGRPYYHLWYLYTLAGVYILVPGIIRIKQSLSKKAYIILGILWFCASCVSAPFCSFRLAWGVHTVACFSSWFVIGDIIGNRKKKISKFSTVLLLLVSIVCSVLTGLWEVCQNYVQPDSVVNYINASNNFSPTVALGSIALFSSVKGWNAKCNVYCLTKHSLSIYLAHAFFLEFFDWIYRICFASGSNPLLWVVCCTAATFYVSYLWSKCTAFLTEVVYTKIDVAVGKVFIQTKKQY